MCIEQIVLLPKFIQYLKLIAKIWRISPRAFTAESLFLLLLFLTVIFMFDALVARERPWLPHIEQILIIRKCRETINYSMGFHNLDFKMVIV